MKMEKKDTADIAIQDLNPTFLYTWKGMRARDKDTNFHSHEHLELAFILSGEGQYRFEEGIFPVKEGDVLILNPGERHQALACPEVEVPATEFFVGALDIQIEGMPPNTLPVPGGGHILHTTGELRQKLFRICASMEAENALCRQGKYFMMKAYLMQLLLLVVREQFEPVERTGGYVFESVNRKYVVEQIANYFEDHYAEKISLDQIAENMYLSPFYVSKIFKSETGVAPIRYLINIRLEKAMELLEGGCEGSIQDVAASVGYEDAYHFSKLFKKHFGISPSQARKKA